jgi:two-component system KDP operon response regulator KdpE
MPHALVADPDLLDSLPLRRQLTLAGYAVRTVATARAALAEVRTRRPDVALLELELPDGAQVDLLGELAGAPREARPTAVVVLSRRGALEDKLAAFAAGADDYLVKPCAWEEVVARVGAVLRCAGRAVDEADAGEELWTIDHGARCVRRGATTVPLRPKEFELLAALWAHRGRVMTRDELLRGVWGYAEGTTTRTVDSHIFALRRKLEPVPHRPRYIVTVSRAGYRLVG